jgi:hypothetical protein
MQTALHACTKGCRGECLHAIELIPYHTDAAFCDFVCQFISQDCPRVEVCTEQPCANFPLCGNLAPQWVLDLHGGICQQPCNIMYGCAFQFSKFPADDLCPVCLEPGVTSLVFQCRHMICARCYGRAAFNEAASQTLKRCPICRVESRPLMRELVDTNFRY